jgi:HEAT repeat protein
VHKVEPFLLSGLCCPVGRWGRSNVGQDFKTKLQSVVEQLAPDDRALTEQGLEALLQAGGDSFEGFFAVLRDPSAGTNVRQTACWFLGRLGNKRQAVPALLGLLLDHEADPGVRGEAARSLALLRSKRSLQPLIAALGDTEVEVRTSAAYALGSLADERAFDALLKALSNREEDPQVRGMVAEALARFQDRRAVAPLIAALHDPSAEVRFWASFALAGLGDPQALPDLERLAAADEAVVPGWWSVKKEAADAIESIKARLAADENT